jgi:hypothetical protein
MKLLLGIIFGLLFYLGSMIDVNMITECKVKDAYYSVSLKECTQGKIKLFMRSL